MKTTKELALSCADSMESKFQDKKVAIVSGDSVDCTVIILKGDGLRCWVKEKLLKLPSLKEEERRETG